MRNLTPGTSGAHRTWLIRGTLDARPLQVVDEGGACCGIVALADVARHAAKREAGEVVKEVSEPSSSASVAG